MIVIFSRDADAIHDISRIQANTPQAVFGPARPAFTPVPTLQNKEDLYLIVQSAKRAADWQPVVGDKEADTYWTAKQAIKTLERVIPDSYAGNIYVAACETADPESSIAFAGSFKTELLTTRRVSGKFYGLESDTHGPIPPPADRRWIEAPAAA